MRRGIVPAVLLCAAGWLGLSGSAAAQTGAQPAPPDGDNGESADLVSGWRPTVFVYFLQQMGGEAVDPFGATGRREVLQLMMDQTPDEGRFLRVRMDGQADGSGDRVQEEAGYYQIVGGTIVLHHAPPDGAVGRVETGSYFTGVICLSDAETGTTLRYDFESSGSLPPPTGPAAEPSKAARVCAR